MSGTNSAESIRLLKIGYAISNKILGSLDIMVRQAEEAESYWRSAQAHPKKAWHWQGAKEMGRSIEGVIARAIKDMLEQCESEEGFRQFLDEYVQTYGKDNV